ncbi:MAG: electron transfer flavoprotein subunit beta [Dehalococcoidales bacterium]|jgi:electron transfer flavoprotein beta subunit|nr:electron transfer flavoprotein subunit beta [Dehalococcoidales bacterium]MDP6576293.1 electron transfer flavoprotein subunit beta/FixA family protein [Dehalococcoidales bacterium]MDP6824786.1 electron transfer flavoprotein subunit beta/FixA family protein [Dehalococcoidales bacterium]
MNVIVCLKQVPGTTDVKVNPQTNTLIRQGVENVINPFDTYALEEGVRTKERYGEGKVTAMSMGPLQAEAVMREAISLGADEAVLLSDKAFAGADTWATAYTLAQAINKIGQHDIIICGRQTIDGDTGQVGPELAEILEIPFVAYVSQIEEIADGRIRVQRMVEEGHEVIESSLPAVITVVKEINVPRLPSLRGITRSKSAPVAIWSAREIGVDESRVGLAGSFTKVIKVFFPQRVSQSEVFQGEMESQVDCLIDRLKDTGLT